MGWVNTRLRKNDFVSLMKNLFSVNFIPDDIPSYLCQPETNSILALKMDMVNMNNISVEIEVLKSRS